jgi:hypothetical protein
MKTILRHVLLGVAVAACGVSAWGDPLPPRSAGKVLVLESGRTLEGDIDIQGTQFRIRRSTGEVWVPVEPGMRLCADWNEAFAFMAGQTNRLDPDERVRLARWCQLHGLREQALAELNAAVRMQPNHREARQMRDSMQRALVMEKTDTAAAKTLATPPSKLPALDVSSDAVAMFTTRVQPILMNTCASCHSGAQAGRFQLYRTYNGGQRAATLKNLAAVLPLINPESPELSVFLIKAVSPHSSIPQSPLKKESVPFYTLQTWVLQLLANNPQLRAHQMQEASPPSARATWSALEVAEARLTPKSTAGMSGKSEERATEKTVNANKVMMTPAKGLSLQAPPAASTKPATARNEPSEPATTFAAPTSPLPATPVQQTSFSERSPSAPAEPTDPFDPVIFNRQTRPQQ